MTTAVSRLHSELFASTLWNARPLIARHCCTLLSLLIILIFLPGKLTAQEEALSDNTPVFELVATDWGDVLIADNISVSMRDGITISVDIYRPVSGLDGNNTYPALYAASPYPHTRAVLQNQHAEAGPVAWYVSQGYAVVLANVRGTGLSGGEYSFMALDEQQDHYEMIEWIAEQPWSDGQVAGTGAGYYGASQWQMAIQNPPHLECIAPVSGALDPYRDWLMPGGIVNNSFITHWYDQKVRLDNAYAGDSQRLVNFDLRLAQLEHPLMDDFWNIRSSSESAALINVPVFALHEWSLKKTHADLTSTMDALFRLKVINKIYIRNSAEDSPVYQDTEFLARELKPFYDWCFNGRQATSAFIERPRIRFQVQGQNTIKSEAQWPPGNIDYEDWYLNNTASENQTGSLDEGQLSGNPIFSVWNSSANDDLITFLSAPLEENLEINGSAMVELYISSSNTDQAFEVVLREQSVETVIDESPALPGFLAPERQVQESVIAEVTHTTVTRGGLKASARSLDPGNSSTYMPVYSLSERQTVIPGQIYRLDIALRHTAYRFTEGNRLVLEVRAVNDGTLSTDPSQEMLYHSSQSPSRLWLPVVQGPLTQARLNTFQPNDEVNPAVQDPAPDIPITEEPSESSSNDEQSPVFFVPQ